MITWGISANSHDAALAVFNNKELVFASHSERFSKVKNDAHLNKKLINYAKNNFGPPDKIVWYEKPFKKSLRQLYAGQGIKFLENSAGHYLLGYDINSPITTVDHHFSHAAGGYFTSKFHNATIVCIDSIGEFETFTVWTAEGTKLKKVHRQVYPHSIGLWYSAMTQRVGLKANEEEYILMGMAAYGDPNRLFRSILDDFIYINDHKRELTIQLKTNLHRGCQWWKKNLYTEQDMFDIAAGTQCVYEYILKTISCWARRNFASQNLVLTGGCALNCSANSKIADMWDNIWVMPNPGDAGSAVGCVLATQKEHISFDNLYLGYNISGNYPCDEIINELLETGVCGVANGRAEYGPRALGNRSLLADPRRKNVKNQVNEIKQRQKFRPFAPSILEEHFEKYFQGVRSYFMNFTPRCKDIENFSSIAHADGTSRVQVVTKESNPNFYNLLSQWYKKTGCPMLLNTSLNVKGKPIVNDLTDADNFARLYNVKVFTKAEKKWQLDKTPTMELKYRNYI